MSRIFLRGLGAVSPAGWGCDALRTALTKGEPLPTTDLPRPGWPQPLRVRAVPPLGTVPAFLNHPRLRRSGVMAQHAVAAGMEALRGDASLVPAGQLRLGIIVCLLTGIVAYSRRFYEEVLRDPASASPVLFPETVFNAPASHLAACLGAKTLNYTLVGDEGIFLNGLALAAQWIGEGQVEGCLVIGAEELDWLVPDALHLFSRPAIHGSGAGALYLHRESAGAIAELLAITDSFSLTQTQSRPHAARRMRTQLPAGAAGELLCLSGRDLPRYDAAENEAWGDWAGLVQRPKKILGEAFVASAAWQCVTAVDAMERGEAIAANVSVVGASQQAIGARFGPLSE